MAKPESTTTEKPTSQGSPLVPPKKKLRSQPPDIIVAVGQGDNKTEFECYKFLLCCNSEYFDSMFSLPMRENETSRIHLPDKDPEEWKIFYEFFDPTTASLAKVTIDNAMTLAPWFHEYQMNALLAKCDNIIHDNIIKDDNYIKADVLETLLDNLEFCENYSLKRSLEKAINELSVFVMNAHGFWTKNLKLLKRVFDIYKDHKKVMEELLCHNIRGLFFDIDFFQCHNGEDIWENTFFRLWIIARIQNMSLRTQYDYSDSDYRDIKGSLVVKGAGLDVVNGIYIRHSKKIDSVSVFTKRGLYKDAPSMCYLSYQPRKKRWSIKISQNGARSPTYYYNTSGTVNDLPHRDKWVTEPGKGVDPPPTSVEYQSQTSSLSDDGS